MKTSQTTVGNAYDFIEPLQIRAVGDFPDITSAFYDGNYDKTFHEAQRDKHDWVLRGMGFKAGDKIVDIGCGWGPMLVAVKGRGGQGIGLTVSKKQAEYCKTRGLDIFLMDWKETIHSTFGKFDGVVSIGAFEHFCSPQEYYDGRQERIYRDFFKFCHGCLSDGKKLFLQTMTWGNKVFRPEELAPNAPPNSSKRIISTLLSLSSWWPPISKGQIIETASPYFRLAESNNGRLDYIQTFADWYKLLHKAQNGNILLKLVVARQYTLNRDFRKVYGFWRESLKEQYFKKAFEQCLLNHERMFFEKR